MSDVTTKNARITAATISNEDHGILSVWITLDYGGSGQGFGGFCLHSNPKRVPLKEQGGYAGHFIWRCMDIAGVNRWQDMVGKTIRARGNRAQVEAIGHILEDDWFEPAKDFAEVKEAA